MKYALSIENLSKYYSWKEGGKRRHFTALEDLNLQIQAGEVWGFIGANGAGKSTLLKILARITPPSRGQVRMNGRASALLEVGTGFHPELSGRENVFLNGAILGMSRSDVKRHFDQIVAFAGIEDFLEVPVKRYSSGMFVRLAFSVAAHLDSPILLIDEVLAVGDAEFQQRCLNRMREITREEGRTVIFVSHQMHHVRELCQQVGHLQGGRLQHLGPAEETIDLYLRQQAQVARSQSLAERSDRRGNQQGYFTALAMEANPASTAPAVLRPGRPARLLIHYYLKQPGRVDFQLNVLHPSGHFLTSLHSRLAHGPIHGQAGEQTMACALEQLPFTPGSYTIRAHLFLEGQRADVVEQACEFTVEEGDYYHNGEYLHKNLQGIFIPQKWHENP